MLNIIEIENKSNELLKKLFQTISPKYNLLELSDFFNELFQHNNKAIADSYILPLLNAYHSNLVKFDPFGFTPHNSRLILSMLNKILKLEIARELRGAFESEYRRISHQLSELNRVLRGDSSVVILSRPSFPALEIREDNLKIGSLENISIKITQVTSENSFLIIPSGREIEKKISDQVKDSWTAAIEVAKNYIRSISQFHEIIVYLDKKSGDYVGNSMGVVLTIVMIEELLKVYNAASEIIIKKNIAFTGGLTKDGKVIPVSSMIIENKLDTIFFSPIQNFVLHYEDKQAAYNRLDRLKDNYPNRDLKISTVENFSDVLNRRDIVDIKKRNLFLRSFQVLRNNVAAVALAVLLGIVIVYSGMIDFDNNPSILENHGNTLYVKNKNGKVLWAKKMGFDKNNIYERMGLYLSQKIYDIDEDGINEVILCNEHVDEFKKGEGHYGRISAFNSNGTLKWEYIFDDTASTIKDSFTNIFYSSIIDIVEINNQKLIYAIAKHEILYASAIYSLDLETGKRVNDVLWHPGHISGGLINDFNGDGKFELYAIAANNGLERTIVFSIDINKIEGCAPSAPSYIFNGEKFADFNDYILLPKTDLNKILGNRFNSPMFGNFLLSPDNLRINFAITEAWNGTSPITVYYQFFYRKNKFEIYFDDKFQILRDSLAKESNISSNSKEYKQSLLEQIKYWNGHSFVSNDPNKK